MEYNIHDKNNELSLYILISKDTVVGIDSRLLALTGYNLVDVIGKGIDYVFKLLKLKKIEGCYILITKDFNAIEVYLNYDKNMYTFIQKPYGNLRDKFKYYEQLHLNKGRGFAAYNASNLVLLTANNEYENYINKQYGFEEFHIGKTFYEISNDNLTYSRLHFFKTVLKTGNTLNINIFKYKNVLHKEIFLEITFIPIYEDNKIKYILESFSDVTERETQKAQLILFEKQKEFFLFICHEFKMPLTVILSAIQMFKIACKDELSSNSSKYIKKIKQASLQQLRLVNSLLDILKSDSGNIKIYKKNLDIVKVTKAIIETVSVYSSIKGVKIKFSSSMKEQIIGVDDEKYERILLNLLSNAIKFTPRGKTIQVKLDLEDSNVRIEVKDNGVGISNDKLDVIFELFGQAGNSLTREDEGTGIGLYLVKQLINTLGGKIEVTSKIGKGSSFVVLLPKSKIQENIINLSAHNFNDNHLVESTDIEFSNIYFD